MPIKLLYKALEILVATALSHASPTCTAMAAKLVIVSTIIPKRANKKEAVHPQISSFVDKGIPFLFLLKLCIIEVIPRGKTARNSIKRHKYIKIEIKLPPKTISRNVGLSEMGTSEFCACIEIGNKSSAINPINCVFPAFIYFPCFMDGCRYR